MASEDVLGRTDSDQAFSPRGATEPHASESKVAAMLSTVPAAAKQEVEGRVDEANRLADVELARAIRSDEAASNASTDTAQALHQRHADIHRRAAGAHRSPRRCTGPRSSSSKPPPPNERLPDWTPARTIDGPGPSRAPSKCLTTRTNRSTRCRWPPTCMPSRHDRSPSATP